ncbi:hypothetical protein [Paracoccus shanxieyensis]|uniref:Uncharacterized protein n=1 Tax=Paracoccus shanxieyensis TaxID=2675752 RepID=A0A6L6IZ58_9RHOB|nr:hypothetical protein [Paracoccus shanxieyensis]MTH65199.1 hypothetical protein [Paracoccus shanxieyensis]MTH88343.1 hypothetical protein [Paracoccus shanxieyensis]
MGGRFPLFCPADVQKTAGAAGQGMIFAPQVATCGAARQMLFAGVIVPEPSSQDAVAIIFSLMPHDEISIS